LLYGKIESVFILYVKKKLKIGKMETIPKNFGKRYKVTTINISKKSIS
jgi:hypothetical protein